MKHLNNKYTHKERLIQRKLWNAAYQRPDAVVLYGELLEAIGASSHTPKAANLLQVYIRRLRQKMGGKSSIITVQNVGYFLKLPNPERKRGAPMNESEQALFNFFKEADGRIVTAEQVADFIKTAAKTPRSRNSVATFRIVKLREVLPSGHSIVAYRGVGYSMIIKPPKVPAASSVISGEVTL